jgi:hypothetical protein
VDLADPEKPVIVKSVKDWPTKSLLDMVIYQGKLYGASGTRVFRCDLTDPLNPVEDKNWTAPDKAMQGYYYIDACDGILAAKKYPRIDAWRIEE